MMKSLRPAWTDCVACGYKASCARRLVVRIGHTAPAQQQGEAMANHNQKGFGRIWHATLYSLAGIRAAWKHEAAFRQEVLLSVILVPAAFWLGGSTVERLLLLGSCRIVLITELLNSAVEAAIDRISDDKHRLSARAKDLGSAAVFISLWLAGITWALIGYDRLFG
jgi:diacylglycerol kinase (ATP)